MIRKCRQRVCRDVYSRVWLQLRSLHVSHSVPDLARQLDVFGDGDVVAFPLLIPWILISVANVHADVGLVGMHNVSQLAQVFVQLVVQLYRLPEGCRSVFINRPQSTHVRFISENLVRSTRQASRSVRILIVFRKAVAEMKLGRSLSNDPVPALH